MKKADNLLEILKNEYPEILKEINNKHKIGCCVTGIDCYQSCKDSCAVECNENECCDSPCDTSNCETTFKEANDECDSSSEYKSNCEKKSCGTESSCETKNKKSNCGTSKCGEESSKIEDLFDMYESTVQQKEELQRQYNNLLLKCSELKEEFKSFKNKSEVDQKNSKIKTIKKFASDMISMIGIFKQVKEMYKDPNIAMGFDMLEKQFLEILHQNNVKKIDVKEGDMFDENTMEAIGTVEGQEKGLIKKVISEPFEFEGHLIIFGKVVVSV